jgi:hypothetical protein
MYTYQKVMIGLAILSFALPILTAALGVYIRPLDDPIGGGSPG